MQGLKGGNLGSPFLFARTGNTRYNGKQYLQGPTMPFALSDVIAKFPEHVRKKYDFSRAVYTTALKPIVGIVCSKHGEFSQYAAQLRKDGAGCPSCGAEKKVASSRMPNAEFISKAMALHKNKYDYGKTQYVNMTTKIIVGCPIHGEFSISPIKHLHSAQGCPDCGATLRGKRLDLLGSAKKTAATKLNKFADNFEQQSRQVHKDKYDYSKAVYVGAQEKLEIVCQVHGSFMQTPEQHIKRGYGCPACGHILSKQEAEIAKFLSKFTTVVKRDRSIIKPKELDIYLPEKNLAIEYCGMYWHSHDSKEDEAATRNRHKDKYVACQSKKVRLLTIYESEWQNHKYAIQRLLRNAIGKSKGSVMARKCVLQKVDVHEARKFFDKYHPQGGNGIGEHYGLYYKSRLVACMRFTFGVNDRGVSNNRVWTLSRYATRLTVSGGASRLLKTFINEKNPTEIKSFSDNRYFSGEMYLQLGFVLEEELPADYQVWSQKLGLLPKTKYQRRELPKRLKEHKVLDAFNPETDPRSEADITYLMGARRIYDCGKKRWLWKSLDTPNPQ